MEVQPLAESGEERFEILRAAAPCAARQGGGLRHVVGLVVVEDAGHLPAPMGRLLQLLMTACNDSRSASFTISQRSHATGSINLTISRLTMRRRSLGFIASSSQQHLPWLATNQS